MIKSGGTINQYSKKLSLPAAWPYWAPLTSSNENKKWDFTVAESLTGTGILTGHPTMRSLARRSSPCRWACLRMERAESEAGLIPPSSSRASQYCSSLWAGAWRQWGKDRGDRGDAGGSLDCQRREEKRKCHIKQDLSPRCIAKTVKRRLWQESDGRKAI